jgi:hypothetical protein
MSHLTGRFAGQAERRHGGDVIGRLESHRPQGTRCHTYPSCSITLNLLTGDPGEISRLRHRSQFQPVKLGGAHASTASDNHQTVRNPMTSTYLLLSSPRTSALV